MQPLCLGLPHRPWPTFVSCGSSDSLIFRGFAVCFGLRGWSGTAPQVPVGAAWRTGLAYGVSWWRRGISDPLGGGLPGRATCLGEIPFSSVASCSPATPLNVRKGEESQAHGDKGASQAQITCCIGRIPLFVPPGHLSQAEQGREVSDAMEESASHDHIPLWVSYQSPFWMLG